VVEGLPDDYYKTYASKIERVTAADVRRVAQKWIDPAKMSVVLVGDEKQIAPGVRTLVGEYERRGVDGALVETAPMPPAEKPPVAPPQGPVIAPAERPAAAPGKAPTVPPSKPPSGAPMKSSNGPVP
jgi:zinc protease